MTTISRADEHTMTVYKIEGGKEIKAMEINFDAEEVTRLVTSATRFEKRLRERFCSKPR